MIKTKLLLNLCPFRVGQRMRMHSFALNPSMRETKVIRWFVTHCHWFFLCYTAFKSMTSVRYMMAHGRVIGITSDTAYILV